MKWSSIAEGRLPLQDDLIEANKLLEQTIKVLEGLMKFPHQWCRADLGDVPRSRCICGKAQRDALAKPLLDNLKALKKEGTE